MLKRIKKRYIFTIILLGIPILTNPNKDDYIQFTEETIGDPPIDIEVEQINFVIFSSYTPIIFGEHGITHLGIFGQFIQFSEGQFDYPAWLELFK